MGARLRDVISLGGRPEPIPKKVEFARVAASHLPARAGVPAAPGKTMA